MITRFGKRAALDIWHGLDNGWREVKAFMEDPFLTAIAGGVLTAGLVAHALSSPGGCR